VSLFPVPIPRCPLSNHLLPARLPLRSPNATWRPFLITWGTIFPSSQSRFFLLFRATFLRVSIQRLSRLFPHETPLSSMSTPHGSGSLPSVVNVLDAPSETNDFLDSRHLSTILASQDGRRRSATLCADHSLQFPFSIRRVFFSTVGENRIPTEPSVFHLPGLSSLPYALFFPKTSYDAARQANLFKMGPLLCQCVPCPPRLLVFWPLSAILMLVLVFLRSLAAP